MLGAKRTHGRALGTKHMTVDLLGAKMVIHDEKEKKPAMEEKKVRLEKN